MSKKGVILSKILIYEFSRFFGIYFDLILLKNGKKGSYFPSGTVGKHGPAWDPRGCDMARKATWQSHASPLERQRDADVARMCGRAT